ncbi:MAG: hypothetical protein D6736_12360, partial [Nitrospinota bacterium]
PFLVPRREGEASLREWEQKSAAGIEAGERSRQAALAKLAEPLRDLAERVAREGKDGNLTLGKIRVLDYKVDVIIYLRDTSAATMKALQGLGFIQSGESKAIRLVIGRIDVRKLEQLARLESVLRVSPLLG